MTGMHTTLEGTACPQLVTEEETYTNMKKDKDARRFHTAPPGKNLKAVSLPALVTP